MSVRMLMILSLATAAVLALALYLVQRPGNEAVSTLEQPLLPGLKERVNAIEAIDIVGADGELSVQLRRERDRWRVREKHDYEADFAQIHELLRDLAEARRLEAKTSNPEFHSRLGLADPGSGEGSGVLLRWPQADLPGLIIGHRDPAGIGRYARLAEAAQSWLTDRDVELDGDPLAWLQRAVMDIPAADIAELTVRHPDGEVVELRPADETGETWVLLDAPADREVKPAWRLRQSADALSRLNLEDVRPRRALPEDAIEAVFATRDGLRFTASLFSEDDAYWIHFDVAAADRAERTSGAVGQDGEAEDSDADAQADGQPDESTRLDAVAVDGRLSPWLYEIERSRFERLTPRMEDLLEQPVEDADTGAGGG